MWRYIILCCKVKTVKEFILASSEKYCDKIFCRYIADSEVKSKSYRTIQKRGGKGVKCYKITEKTGEVIGVKAVNDDHEIMMITTEGIIIQLRMEDISTLGRITSGVKMMNVDKDVKVARIAKVREKVSDGTTEYEDIDAAVENMDDSQDE